MIASNSLRKKKNFKSFQMKNISNTSSSIFSETKVIKTHKTGKYVLAPPSESDKNSADETQKVRKVSKRKVERNVKKSKKSQVNDDSKIKRKNCNDIDKRKSKRRKKDICVNGVTNDDEFTEEQNSDADDGDGYGYGDENEKVEDVEENENSENDDDSGSCNVENEIYESEDNEDNTQNSTDKFNNKLSHDNELMSSDESLDSISESDDGNIGSKSGFEQSEDSETRNENLTKVKKIRLYKIENENRYILHLPCSNKFQFQGKIQITLLHGEIEIFGYRLGHFSENKTLRLYNPRHCMQFSIKSMIPFSIQRKGEAERLIQNKFKLSEEDLTKLWSSFRSEHALILVEKFFSTCPLIMDHYCDIDLFLQKEIMQKGGNIERDLGCFVINNNVRIRKEFTPGQHWYNIQPGYCTIICGGKGVGKSTLLKFLINTQLSMRKSVLCLDLDPGQTEFTTSGCVSAVVVEKPLLGPNFTNIKTPRKMAYLGMVNVALDPVKYMKAVNYIVQSCREDPDLSDLPWFINTMGFNKGIGLDIMINIIKLLKPDCVVQITSSDVTKNYAINFKPTSVEKHCALSFLPEENESLNYRLLVHRSCSRSKAGGFQSGFRPDELRQFMTISYFSPVFSMPYCSLNAVPPYWIHFSKVCIAVNGIVQPDFILKAINGNIVGLCNIDKIECKTKTIAITDSNDSLLKIAIQPEVAPCFGIGLVRGIDCTEEKIYVITPLTSEELINVNCLYLGNIDPPASFYMKQLNCNKPIVYTDFEKTRKIRMLKQSFRYKPEVHK